MYVNYNMYYNPISSEQGGGLIMCSWLIYEYTIHKHPLSAQELRAEEGVGL